MPGPALKRRKLSHSPTPSSDEEHEISGRKATKLKNGAGIGIATKNFVHGKSKLNEEEEDYDGDDTVEDDSLPGDGSQTQHITNTVPAPHIPPIQASKKSKPQKKMSQNPLLEEGAYAEEIYKSTFFKLQVDELLKQAKSKSQEENVENVLRQLKSILEEAGGLEPVSVAEAGSKLKKLHGVTIPFPSPRPSRDAKYKLEFQRPSYINAIGSFPTKLVTKDTQEILVDLIVIMPSSIFQHKDYLNYRYFYKRAYYLANIAALIKADKRSTFELSYDSLHGNQLLPVLVVRPNSNNTVSGTKYTHFSVRILPAVSETVFPLEKTLLNRNCVRPMSESETEQKKLAPTPFYNSSVRVDSSMTHFLKSIHRASATCEAFQNACILGRLWLLQRGFSSSMHAGGFGNFEWSAVMAVLLQSGKSNAVLSSGYSSYQLFKATLQFLASRDLSKHHFFSVKGGEDFSDLQEIPIFFDSSAGINVLYKMSPWSYRLLREEAAVTLKALGDDLFDPFSATFKIRVDPLLLRHDLVMNIPAQSLKLTSDDGIADSPHARLTTLYNLLSRGLGDRISSIAIQSPKSETWKIDSGRPVKTAFGSVNVGLSVDFANAARAIDRGPSAESKEEAAAFRKFWGGKAELRKFKDGSIVETLEWSAKVADGPITQQIISHIMSRHFSKEAAESITFFGGHLGQLLPEKSTNAGVAPFKPLMAAFTTLERDLRALDELPLQFRHILASSPYLSYSAVDVSTSSVSQQSSHSLDVVIEFEGSARWPDDLPAIQKTKIAFLLKIAEVFEQHHKGVHVRVGLENEDDELLNQSFLDITYPTGASFRLRIRLDREQALLERLLKQKKREVKAQEGLAAALAAYKRTFLHTPSHVQALQTLSTRYPALSPSIRLTKKWFNSHLLSHHIPEPVIELLVVRTFVQPYPWSAPTSASAGLLRTLFFLSRWDWRTEPLIVDLSASMKPEDVKSLETRFEAWRKIDPGMTKLVLFAASSVDPDGSTWTDNARPPKVIAARMVALAQAARHAVINQSMALDIRTLFMSPLTDYDFVIHLNPATMRIARDKAALSSDGQFKNLQLQNFHASFNKYIGFKPVSLLLADLERLFGSCALFFHDGTNGRIIAGLWNPTAATPRQWKVMIGHSTMPVVKNGGATVEAGLNKEGILGEIASFGGDMVERIEVQKT